MPHCPPHLPCPLVSKRRALGLAAHLGEFEILDYLVDVGADIDFLDEGCLSTFKLPSHAANSIARKDWQRHVSFVSAGSLDSSAFGSNPLQELARRYLSGDPAAFCSNGTTALHVCVMHDQPAMVRFAKLSSSDNINLLV